MTETEFYFLYINVNCIAELALRELAANAVASAGTSQSRHASTDSLRIEDLDFSALDGLDEMIRNHSVVAAPTLDAPVPQADRSEDFDLTTYVERAYSHEDQVRNRASKYWRAGAARELSAIAAAASATLAPLTARLSADALSDWLQVYLEGDAQLDDLVARVRALDG